MVPVVAIVPLKSFELGKRRLSASVGPETRRRIGMAFAQNTVSMAEAVGLIPVIVAGDDAVADWSIGQGIPWLPDPGTGLNDAAEEGVSWASVSGAGWLVVHADLPLMSRRDLELPRDIVEDGETVLAPSADGGTSLFGSNEAQSFAYGPGSFSTHLARNPQSRVVTSLGLLHDVDSVNDLESASRHPRGRWLADLAQ